LNKDVPVMKSEQRSSKKKISYTILACLQIHISYIKIKGQAVVQLVEAPRYKSEGSGFDSWWCN
jgi:hypothetical protein